MGVITDGEHVLAGGISGVCVMAQGDGVFLLLGGSTGNMQGEGTGDTCVTGEGDTVTGVTGVMSGDVRGEAGKGTDASILLRYCWYLLKSWSHEKT